MWPLRLTACVLLLVVAVPAQESEDQAALRLLEDVRTRFRELLRHRDLAGLRAGERELERLTSMRFASAEVRERGCAFLRREILDRNARDDQLFRWRVEAVRLIARLADEPSWVDYLLRLARSSRNGLDLYVERAMGSLRSPAQISRLLERANDGLRSDRSVALGALVRLERSAHLPLLQSGEHLFVKLSRSRDTETAARAVAVLGRLETGRARVALVEATGSRAHLVRQAAARALGAHVHSPAVRSALVSLLEDHSPRVREEAVRSLGQSADQGPVPRLIERLSYEPLRVRAAIRTSLRQLTRMDFGTEPAPWQAWATGGKVARETTPTPAYYGIPMSSDRVVFVLDLSASMGWRAGVGIGVETRLQRAKTELSQLLRSLDARTRFGIATFSSSVRHFSRRGLKPATPENVSRALAWVAKRVAGGSTNTYRALNEVFDRYPEADSVFFLSDGAPSAGPTTVQERILRDLIGWNRSRAVRFHTIALLQGGAGRRDEGPGDKREAQRFLQTLADETGGDFVVLR